jgi:NAD(P)-dependent dehydrogenase (short-subunit alcohol dehydrogenase family)
VAADERADEVSTLVETIRSRGRDAHAVALDLTDEAQVQVAVGETQRAWGRLGILINNAGTDVTLPVEDVTVADWDPVIKTDLRARFLTSKHALPLMSGRYWPAACAPRSCLSASRTSTWIRCRIRRTSPRRSSSS